MPELKSSTPTRGVVYDPVTVLGNAANVPLPFKTAIVDIPDSRNISYLRQDLQLSKADDLDNFENGHVIPALHFFNPPIRNDALVGSRNYLRLKTLTDNSNVKDQIPFWMQYRNAAKRFLPGTTITKDVAIEHSDELNAVVTEYFLQYRSCKLYQAASMFNFFTLLCFNGDERTKNIMRNVRWSWLNGFLNQYAKTPIGKGDESYLLDFTRPAVGRNSTGGDIVSLPWWNSTIFGNIGCERVSPDNLVKHVILSDGTRVADPSFDYGKGYGVQGDDEAMLASELMNNIHVAKYLAGQDANYKIVLDEKTGKVKARSSDTGVERPVASLPHVENAYTLWAHSGDFASSAHMNEATEQYFYSEDWNQTDNLTARAWNSYVYWTNLIEKVFPEMSNSRSDLYLIAQQLGLFEDSSIPDNLRRAVKDNCEHPYDIFSLAQNMAYRDGTAQKTTNATVVRWAPPVAASDPRASHVGIINEALADAYNFRRYHFELENIEATLAFYRAWPHFDPAVFCTPVINSSTAKELEDATGYAIEPAVINSIPSLGDPYENGILTPTGKYGVLYDNARVNAEYRENENELGFIGITKAVADKVTTLHPNNFIFKEAPMQVMSYQMPLIDTSDPFQCGFYALIADDDAHDNIWRQYFMDVGKRFTKASVSETGEVTYGDDVDYPASPAFKPVEGSNSAYQREDVANKDYLKMMKHCLIFLGGDIFDHPIARFTHPLCSFPVQQITSNELQLETKEYASMVYPDASEDPEPVPQWCSVDMTQVAGKCLRYAAFGIYDGYHYERNGSEFFTSPAQGWSQAFADNIAESYFQIFLTDPKYGPVNIIASLPPAAYLADKMPHFWVEGDNSFSSKNANPAMNPNSKLLPFDVGITDLSIYSGSVGAGAINAEKLSIIRFSTDDFIRAPSWWLFFIDSIKNWYSRSYYFGTERPRGKAPVTLNFRCQNKWAATLAANIVASSMSANAQINFWDAIDPKAEKPSIGTTSSIPGNDILPEPREARSTRSNNNARDVYKGDSRPTTRFEAADTAFRGKSSRRDGDAAQHSRQDPSSSKRADRKSDKRNSFNRRFGLKGSPSTDDPMAVISTVDDNQSKLDDKLSSSQTASGAREGSMNDSSSKRQDSEAEKKGAKSRKTDDATSVQVS
jgi:hypothetical protein